MMIGERLRQLREERNLSQGHLETKTGLLRCYTSRVENGHTVPSIETIEKYAHALGIPLFEFFIEPGAAAPKNPVASISASTPQRDKIVGPFRSPLEKMGDRNRKILLSVAHAMARHDQRKRKSA